MSDMLSNAMEAIVRRFVGQRIDFLAAYPSKAVQQNADGTLELVPDSDRLPTYKRVPIRYGVPGVTATIAPGARVLLQFAEGDPQKPMVTGWESASVTALNLGGSGATHPLIFGDDFSSPSGALNTLLQAIAAQVGTSGSPAGATAAAAAIVTAISAYQTAVAAKLSTVSKTV